MVVVVTPMFRRRCAASPGATMIEGSTICDTRFRGASMTEQPPPTDEPPSPTPTRLFVVTITAAVLSGAAAVAFFLVIRFFEILLIESAMRASGRSWMVWTIVTPTLGGLVCGLLLEYVVPNARGSGIPQVKAAFANAAPVVRLRDAIGKFVVGSLQIGSGASLGKEGPTAHIAAGIASWLGRRAGLSASGQRGLLPVGVAAGIAAAFNAPIAAVTFTLETLLGRLDHASITGVIVAAAVAQVVGQSLGGFVLDVGALREVRDAPSLSICIVIGAIAAVASVSFTESLLAVRAALRRLSVVPAWARPALGGFVTGVLAVAALHAFGVSGITGGGQPTLVRALGGQLAWHVMLVLGLFKLAATVASYSSGGAGGIFASSLFIGGMLGGAVGALTAPLAGHVEAPVSAFALIGMGAVFAGVIRAPITSVLIIVEMTGSASLILPLMVANTTAYLLARRVRRISIYEALLVQDGTKHGPSDAPEAAAGATGASPRAPVLGMPRFRS
jgi:CIC family chloride channel protein